MCGGQVIITLYRQLRIKIWDMSPPNPLPSQNFRGYEITSETIFETRQCILEASRQSLILMYEYLSTFPAHCAIQHWF